MFYVKGISFTNPKYTLPYIAILCLWIFDKSVHVFQRETAVLTKTTRITFSMCYLFPHACNFGWKTRRTVPSNEPRRSECHDVSAQESPDPKTITSCHSKSYQVDSLGFKDCKQIHLTKQVSEADQKNPLLHNCQHPTVKNMCFFSTSMSIWFPLMWSYPYVKIHQNNTHAPMWYSRIGFNCIIQPLKPLSAASENPLWSSPRMPGYWWRGQREEDLWWLKKH